MVTAVVVVVLSSRDSDLLFLLAFLVGRLVARSFYSSFVLSSPDISFLARPRLISRRCSRREKCLLDRRSEQNARVGVMCGFAIPSSYLPPLPPPPLLSVISKRRSVSRFIQFLFSP